MSDPEISIVVVSWNVRDLLLQCLRSIQDHVQTSHEIVVVDNHSSDGTVEAIRQHFPEVIVIANDSNAGFARANNQGWQKTHGRYICFLNPDTEFRDDPFPVLIAAAQEPAVGCVGPKLLNPDGSHQSSIRTFPTLLDQTFVLLKLRWLWRWIPPLQRYAHPAHPETTTPVDQIMGAMMLFPRSVVLDGGSFDEGYWIWFEEVDLCRRLQAKGLRVLYVSSASVVHYGGESFRQHYSLAKHVWLLKSLSRYAGKYWSWPARIALWVLLPISYLLTFVQTFVKPR